MKIIHDLSMLNENIDKINNMFMISKVQIQKIYSSPFFFFIKCRIPQKSFSLIVGRGKGSEFIYASDRSLDSKYRIIDSWLEYLRKYLVNTTLVEIKASHKRRAFILKYVKKNSWGLICFMYARSGVYFVNNYFSDECTKIWRSWSMTPMKVDNQPSIENTLEIFEELGDRLLDNNHANNLKEIDINSYCEKKLERVSEKLNKKQQKKNSLRVDRIKEDIERLKQGIEAGAQFVLKNSQEINQIRELKMGSKKISFLTSSNEFSKRNIVYNRIKKLKSGLKIQLSRLKKCHFKHEDKPIANFLIKKVIVGPDWNCLRNNFLKKDVNTSYDKIEFENYTILVGKNIKGNDLIRQKQSKKNSYWFHLADQHSAHCIVEQKGQASLSPSEKLFMIIGSILRDSSNQTSNEIDIVYARTSDIRPVKGSAGSVIPKKSKIVRVKYMSNWKEIIS